MWYHLFVSRSSIIVRCSLEDAARIHNEAASEHRSLSGYLLYVLQRSIYIDDKVPESVLVLQAPFFKMRPRRTAVHLRCTADEASRIRKYAARRRLSLSDFVVFSLRRVWDAKDSFRMDAHLPH
jgi:hypothetical protein